MAVARQHCLADVRLSGPELGVDAKEVQPVSRRGAQREHSLAGSDVDEDLISRGGSERCPTLAERVGGAHESHRVDGVGREGAVSRLVGVQPRECVPLRVCVPACIRAERLRQVGVGVQARTGTTMVVELDEDRPL